MKNKMIDKTRLAPRISADPKLSAAMGVLSFIASAAMTYLISSLFEMTTWYNIVFAVAVGVMTYCCLRVWLTDESSEDDAVSYIAMTGTLAFIGIILAYIALGVYPFGNHTVLVIDMHHQYVCFLASLRDMLTFDAGWIYSDSLGLGGGVLYTFAYYMSSPFNILLLFFGDGAITEGVALITVLKITAAGASFAYFAKTMTKRCDFSIVACGVAYALIGFTVTHAWNIMWLDCIVLLPLVVAGLEKLLRTGKCALYCITLAMTLICNYYIGYMICIFMVLYYFCHVIADGTNRTVGERARRFWRFCYGSLVGGGISAFICIPVFLGLQSTSGANDSFARAVTTFFNIPELFQRTLVTAYPAIRGDSYPNIYCSVMAVLMLVIFFVCKKIPLRRKIAWGGLLGVLAISLSVNLINFVWHGFHWTNDIPFRYAFLVSFVLLCIALQVLSNIESVTPNEVFISLGVVCGMLMLERSFGDGMADLTMIYVSLAFFVVYAVISGLCAAGKLKQTLCYAVLALFVFVEVTANATVTIAKVDANEYFTERANFYSSSTTAQAALEAIAEYEDDMYREELLPRKTCNDPSLYNYDGMTIFASSNSYDSTVLMGNIGYAINGVNSYLYKNFVVPADSMMSLKYLVLQNAVANEFLTPLGTAQDENGETAYIYQNTAALSKAFLVNDEIGEWLWMDSNPFVVQNSFYSLASGSGDVYDIVLMEQGVNAIADGFNTNVELNGTYFLSSQVNDSVSSSFEIYVKAPQSGQYYIYMDCRAANSIYIRTNEVSTNSVPYEPYVIDLGFMNAGEEVCVELNSSISCGGNIYFARLNTDNFRQAIAALQAEPLDVSKYREGHIEGKINVVESSVLFTSIPYEKGWTVRVDGEKVETLKLGDGFIGIALEPGEHNIEMNYFPHLLWLGIAISAVCLVILLVLIIPKWREWALSLVPQTYRSAVDGGELPYDEENFIIGIPAVVRPRAVPEINYATSSEKGFSAMNYDDWEYDAHDLEEYIARKRSAAEPQEQAFSVEKPKGKKDSEK